LITLNVQGVGPATGLIKVINAAGQSICESFSIPKYGQVLCLTRAMTINSQLSVRFAGNNYACVNSDVSKCAYATNTDSTVSSVQVVGDN